jgi:hypothetical protein
LATNYRSPDRAGYPELDGYTRDEIHEGCLGGGALYLAARMARALRLTPGDFVLDLGYRCPQKQGQVMRIPVCGAAPSQSSDSAADVV